MKKYKLITIIILICFLVSSVVYGKNKIDKTEELNNVAPNSDISANVIHPKKLDIVLMTDYTGEKRSTLLNDVTGTITTLFSKNVDAQLYIEDTSNAYRTGEVYYKQEYDGAPAIINGLSILNNGTNGSTKVNLEYGAIPTYKRKLNSGFGTVTWNSDDTVSFVWNNNIDFYNHLGEAPTGGGVLWDGSNGKIKEVGTSKHAVYILTIDNKLYMAGNATQMAGSYGNVIIRADTPYTGMRQILTGVKEIKSNYNGIAALMLDGTVKYAGNVGAVIQYGDYGIVAYQKVMDVSTTTSSTSYMSASESFLVTNGFVTLPGMNSITRIQLGQMSVIGMNDNTGQVLGIGFNQGQFGWTDPYYMPWTGANNYGKYTLEVQQLIAKAIPLLDAKDIKEIYMYGAYSKVIQKDNTIWRLKGGGFTTHAPWAYYYSYCQHSLLSIEPGSYTKINKLEDTDVFEIDTSPTFSLQHSIGTTDLYQTNTGYTWVPDQTDHYDYSIDSSATVTVKKDGTAVKKNGTYWDPGKYNFAGIKPVYSLNTKDVIDKSYRENSDKIVLYVSDNTNNDFVSEDLNSYYPMTGLTQNFMSFLSKNNFGAYVVTPNSMLDYIEDNFTKQQVSLRQIVSASQDGHVYNTGEYNQAMKDILTKYSKDKEPLNEYVIVGEDTLEYNTQFTDRENDNKKAERWMYSHNPSVFKNNTGTINTNNQWIDTPITTFNKVGEYKITYQTQDDPTLSSNFSNYNLWSNQTEQLKVIAHRRPIAEFSAKIPKKIVTPVNVVTNFDEKNEFSIVQNQYCTIENNGVEGSKALNGRTDYTTKLGASVSVTFNIPANVTDATLKYRITGSYSSVKLNGVEYSLSGNIDSIVSIPIEQGEYTLEVKSSYARSSDDQYYGYFTIDNLEVGYNTSKWINGSALDYTNGETNITYNNTSYDIDHTETVDNAKTLSAVLPDKGIQNEEWKWIDVTTGNTGVWQSGKLSKYTQNHTYQISLRVQDIEGAWSEPNIITLSDNIADKNNPPVAKFTLQKVQMIKGEDNAITDLSYDIDNDPLAEWKWQLLNENNILIANYGNEKPNISTLDIGIYKIALTVRDNPVIPPSMWSNSYILEIEIMDNLSLDGQVNHTDEWNSNRIEYNRSKTGTDDSPRVYEVFFPGERFMLKGLTTEGAACSKVIVNIQEHPEIDAVELINTSNNIWEGSIWDKTMVDWNNQTLNFAFTAIYANGTIKTDVVTVKVEKDEYWRIHRDF